MKADSIPICRSVFEHWVYKDAEHLKVWLTMLGRARYVHGEKIVSYRDVTATINYGEFIFGYIQWEKDTGVSYQRLRTLIRRLTDDGMIQVKQTTSHFTVFYITNYSKFNSQETPTNKAEEIIANSQPTVSQQSANSQPTTNKEGTKKVKNEKNRYGTVGNVFLTPSEYDRLTREFDCAERAIEFLSSYIIEKGYVTKDHNRTIRRWVIDAVRKNNHIPQKTLDQYIEEEENDEKNRSS